MSNYKFKFNKKSIVLDLDETKPYLHHEAGWFSLGIHAYHAIMASPVFDDNDKKRISTLTIFSIFKHLKRL